MSLSPETSIPFSDSSAVVLPNLATGPTPPADSTAQESSAAVAVFPKETSASQETSISQQTSICREIASDRTTVWDVPFDRVTLQQAIDQIGKLIADGKPSYVITANVNYLMLHHRQGDMQSITAGAALILADGQPIVWRSKLGRFPLPERVAGSEMIYRLAEQARDDGWGIYFLGGEPGVAAKCANRLAELYPGLRIAGVESPPFRELTDQEQAAQDERIRSSGAKLLLVAFGQPKGERWIDEHHERLGVPVSIQLGASFDFIAGTAMRAPVFWQRIGLEWAYRMMSDPRRLVPRYASNAVFLASALIEDWKRKVTSWGLGEWSSRSSA